MRLLLPPDAGMAVGGGGGQPDGSVATLPTVTPPMTETTELGIAERLRKVVLQLSSVWSCGGWSGRPPGGAEKARARGLAPTVSNSLCSQR